MAAPRPVSTYASRRYVQAIRLGDVAHGRDNNFQFLRFLAATAVILFHSYALTDRWTDEPLWRLAPELNFGSLGVKSFFVISGFLVTQSWLARNRLLPFVAARALRIYPALILAIFFSIVLASWSNPLPFDQFIALPQSVDYLWRGVLGLEIRDHLIGAYASNPFAHAINGSLWTLPIELRLYIALAIAGAVGLLPRPRAWTLAIAAMSIVFTIWPQWFFLSPNDRVTRDLALLFALGSLAYVWRDAIPLSLAIVAAAVALVILDPMGIGRGLLFVPILAYVLLTIAYHPALQWPSFNGLGDYSYGLYVYSFPIQQTIVRMMPEAQPALMFAMAMLLTLPLAALSWHMVEKPMLGLKSRLN